MLSGSAEWFLPVGLPFGPEKGRAGTLESFDFWFRIKWHHLLPALSYLSYLSPAYSKRQDICSRHHVFAASNNCLSRTLRVMQPQMQPESNNCWCKFLCSNLWVFSLVVVEADQDGYRMPNYRGIRFDPDSSSLSPFPLASAQSLNYEKKYRLFFHYATTGLGRAKMDGL